MKPARVLGAIATVAALVVLISALIWGPDFTKSANIGARYVAKMTCSCIFVVGRDQGSCIADLPETMADFSITVDAEARTVSAAALWFKATARYQEARGCKLTD